MDGIVSLENSPKVKNKFGMVSRIGKNSNEKLIILKHRDDILDQKKTLSKLEYLKAKNFDYFTKSARQRKMMKEISSTTNSEILKNIQKIQKSKDGIGLEMEDNLNFDSGKSNKNEKNETNIKKSGTASFKSVKRGPSIFQV